ncbi:MAG: carboxypeptidase regulatory-like domain-containing protein [Gemmatimonadales bacterium]
MILRRFSLTTCLVFASVVLSGWELHAQSAGTIAGTITDAITGAPIPDVTVAVLRSTLTVQTDAEGKYVIDGVSPGLVKVKAILVGFVPITSDYYTVLPNSTVDVSFRLAPLAYNVSAVEITGERPRTRPAFPGAMVLTSRDLAKRGNILNALQGTVASIKTTGRHDETRLVVRGNAKGVLYVVDGTVITPPLTFNIDTRDVECVEVRRGSAAIQEFRKSINSPTYSGVILIWTTGSRYPRPPDCLKES